MSVINNYINAENAVEFIEYSGKYPNLCSGVLTLKINGKTYRFGNSYKGKNLLKPFWHSGGSCGFTNGYSESYVERNEWTINASELPNELKSYASEIDRVFNANVPFGCCGGCL